MRKSTAFLCFTVLNMLLVAALFLHAHIIRKSAQAGRTYRAGMVRELRLTDLCLFTEARYTRNPAMADLNAPFQDHPGAFEHFPSGSFVMPPGTVTGGR